MPLKISCELVHYFAFSSILKVMGCDGEESVSEKAEGTTASLANFAIRSACIQELTHSGAVGLRRAHLEVHVVSGAGEVEKMGR